MLFESKGNDVRSVGYSALTKELKVVYTNGKMKCYYDVPQEVYNEIKNNGGLISDVLNESLNANYRSNVML